MYVSKSMTFSTPHIGHSRHGLFFTRWIVNTMLNLLKRTMTYFGLAVSIPNHHTIPECSSNYESELKNNSAIPSFAFPTEPVLRKKWYNAIPRKDWEPHKYSYVCLKHFNRDDVIWNQQCNGRTLDTLLKIPRIKTNAVPILFPNSVPYLSKTPPIQRKDPAERLLTENRRIDELNRRQLEDDIIPSFQMFRENFKEKVSIDGWNVQLSETEAVFYIIEKDPAVGVRFNSKIIVNNDLIVRVIEKSTIVPAGELNWVLPRTLKLTLWSELINLLARFKFGQPKKLSMR
jgi:hypothetical protein